MLTIYLSELQIKSVKSDLLHHNRRHKLVTSAHLSEALAFAFGFKANASLIDHLNTTKSVPYVEFCAERFWRRLSELSSTSTAKLRNSLQVDLTGSVARAIGFRDLRDKISLPEELESQLTRFFKLMADHGAAAYTLEGARFAPNVVGYGGFYRPGTHAMRPAFVPVKPALYFEWSERSWSALEADAFLEDHNISGRDLLDWAGAACELMERSLHLKDVVFDAALGLVVHHKEISDCTASIVFQRKGQLGDVRVADARQKAENFEVV